MSYKLGSKSSSSNSNRTEACESLLYSQCMMFTNCIRYYIMSYRKIDSFFKAQIIALLIKSHWRLDAIAGKFFVHIRTAKRWEERMQRYEQLNLSRSRREDRSSVLCTLIKNSLLKFRRQNPWTYQDEMIRFLVEEWNVKIHQTTVSNILKREIISRKKGQRVEHTQSAQLRVAWQIDITSNFVAE